MIELVKAAKGVVLVTHDMEWVTEYCNRAMLLEKGRVVLEGDPEQVVQLLLQRTAEEAEARKAEALSRGLDPAALSPGRRGIGAGGRR